MKRRFTVLLIVAAGACARAPEGALRGYVEGDALLMAAQEAGVVARLGVDEGASVDEGALLFTLDPARAQLTAEQAEASADAVASRAADEGAWKRSVEEAEAALALAEENYRRTKSLFDRKIVAHARLDADRAARDAATARLERARAERDAAMREGAAVLAGAALARRRLADLEVRAPAAGTIERVYRRPGEVVAAGEPVLALLPPENMKLRFYVPQARISSIEPGERVFFSCDGCARELAAQISFIAAEPQFTPPVIYSLEERDKLVFLVEARPEITTGLRPGLPVDVTLP